jgi:hypothetical protein
MVTGKPGRLSNGNRRTVASGHLSAGLSGNHIGRKVAVTSNDFRGLKSGDQRSFAKHLISIVPGTVRHYDVSTRKHSTHVRYFPGSLVFFGSPNECGLC